MRWLLRLGVIAVAVGAVVLGMYAWRDTKAATTYGPSTWSVPVAGLGGGERGGERGRERGGERRGGFFGDGDGGGFTIVALPDDVAASLPAETRQQLAILFGEGRIPQQLLEQVQAGGQLRLPFGDGGGFPGGDGDRGRRGGGPGGGGISLDAADGFWPIILPIAVLCGIAGAFEVARRRRHARARAATS